MTLKLKNILVTDGGIPKFTISYILRDMSSEAVAINKPSTLPPIPNNFQIIPINKVKE